MRLRSVSGTCLVSVLAASIVGTACGSSPDKKRIPHYEGGGEGGGQTTAQAGAGPAGGTTAQGGETTAQAGETMTVQGGMPMLTEPNGGAAGATTIDEVGGAGGVPSAQFHGLYVGKGGLDTGDGTVDAPFSTLAKAASLAKAGDTIVFLDGSYMVGAAATIPDGVDLMAQHSGAATLTASAGNLDLLKLAGSTRITGLKFTSYAHVVTYPAGVAAKGRLTIEDSVFTNCVTACLDLPGDVEASVSAPKDFVVGNGGNSFAVVTGTATFKISGGILQQYGAAGVIRATGDSTVSLGDMQVLDGSGWVLTLDLNAIGTVDGLTAATQSQGLFQQKGESVLTVKNSDLSMRLAIPTVYLCFALEMNGVGSTTVEDSKLHDCNTGFKGSMPGALTITRTDVHDMAFGGIDFNAGAFGIDGILRITDSKFLVNGFLAVRFGGGGIMDAKFRGSTFTGSVQAGAVYVDASAASTMDFGTGAEPGGNSFLSATVNNAGLWIGNALATSTIYAVGNTWTANVQGADAQGHYAALTTPGVLDSTSTVAGQNYSKAYGGTIRLAQNL